METLKSLAAGLGLLVVLALPILGVAALIMWVPWVGWTILGLLTVGMFLMAAVILGDAWRHGE